MEPQQFLYLAQGLVENGAFPVEYRNAISRAYYSVFNAGYIHLESMGFPLPKNTPTNKEEILAD